MKTQYQFENIIADRELSNNEHLRWRATLRKLSRSSGIESICISKEELFIEYNPLLKSRILILEELRMMGFPSKQLDLVSVS